MLQEWKSLSSPSTMKQQQFENDKWTLPWGTRVSRSNYSRIWQTDWETWMSDLNQIRTVAEKASLQNIYLETAAAIEAESSAIHWFPPVVSIHCLVFRVQEGGGWQMDLFVKTKPCCRGSSLNKEEKIFTLKNKKQNSSRSLVHSMPAPFIFAVVLDGDESHSHLQFEDGQGSWVP